VLGIARHLATGRAETGPREHAGPQEEVLGYAEGDYELWRHGEAQGPSGEWGHVMGEGDETVNECDCESGWMGITCDVSLIRVDLVVSVEIIEAVGTLSTPMTNT